MRCSDRRRAVVVAIAAPRGRRRYWVVRWRRTRMTWLLIFAVLALLVCPAAYITLCVRMRRAGIQRPPYIPFFFVFGTVGGWMLALALSPSGLTAMSLIFLATLAPLALVVSSIYLVAGPERSSYHRIALWSGSTYPALLALWILVIVIVGR
jgi:hypothetical protein